MTLYKAEKAKERDCRLVDMPNRLSEQQDQIIELETKIAQMEIRVVHLDKQFEEKSTRNKAMDADFEIKRLKIQRFEDMEKVCTEAGLDIQDSHKFSNCVKNIKDNSYDAEMIIAKVSSLASLEYDIELCKKSMSDYRKKVLAAAEEVDDLNNKVELAQQCLRENKDRLESLRLLD
jgi:hypothetical protein